MSLTAAGIPDESPKQASLVILSSCALLIRSMSRSAHGAPFGTSKSATPLLGIDAKYCERLSGVSAIIKGKNKGTCSWRALDPEGGGAGKTQKGGVIFVSWVDGGCLDGVKKRDVTND